MISPLSRMARPLLYRRAIRTERRSESNVTTKEGEVMKRSSALAIFLGTALMAGAAGASAAQLGDIQAPRSSSEDIQAPRTGSEDIQAPRTRSEDIQAPRTSSPDIPTAPTTHSATHPGPGGVRAGPGRATRALARRGGGPDPAPLLVSQPPRRATPPARRARSSANPLSGPDLARHSADMRSLARALLV